MSGCLAGRCRNRRRCRRQKRKITKRRKGTFGMIILIDRVDILKAFQGYKILIFLIRIHSSVTLFS